MPRPATKSNPALMQAATTAKARSRVPVWLLPAMLVMLTITIYWPATGFDFLNCDDASFVTSNPHVQSGLNWGAVKWAFSLDAGDYWHPVTWLSLMLDASLFGQAAGGFHFTNLALHATNTMLLFLLLQLLTGAFWRSLLVTALFALHPMRVESVAWVAERKDVLSGFFGLLALIAYARYAQRSVISNQSSVISNQVSGAPAADHRSLITDHRSLFYLLSLLFLALGLMSKAVLVTWPFVMLLLDYWPLGRMSTLRSRTATEDGQKAEANDSQGVSRFTFHVSRFTLHAPRSTLLLLVREKIPFFILSGISCVLTYLTEQGRQEATAFGDSSALLRLENALVAYARYLGKTFWPVKLAVPYVDPGHWSWLEVWGSVLVLGGVCVAVFWLGWRRPYLLMGWCWFWGTLIPVIGLTKGWGSFMADRFTYLPSIGLLTLTVLGAWELTRGWRHQALAVSVAGSGAIVVCLALTRQQLGHWKDGEALFRHALEVTDRNYIAQMALGDALEKKGRLDEAIHQFQEALRLTPDYALAHNSLGACLGKQGQLDEAIREFKEASRLKPDYAEAHYNLGLSMLKTGQIDEAIRQFQQATHLKPDYSQAHNNLGAAFLKQSRTDEAIREFQEALRLEPGHAGARTNLDAALAAQGGALPPGALSEP